MQERERLDVDGGILGGRRSVVAHRLAMKDAAARGCFLRALAGRKPLFTPRTVPLGLIFFRHVFSSLHRTHGNAKGEVPVSLFQRTMVRLLRILYMEDSDFNAEDYDQGNTHSLGWYDFVSCWRELKAKVVLSPPERIFMAIEDPSICFLGEVANVTVTVLIFISCVLFIIATLPSLRETECAGCEPKQLEVFDVLEGICIGVFTLEYVVRLCTVPFARSELLNYEDIIAIITDEEPMSTPSALVRYLRFVVQPMNLIDVVVVVPFYVELLAGTVVSNFTVLRVLRLTRLFRLVKLGKYFEALEIIVRVFRRCTKMFYVMGVYLILALCFSSAAMYYVESGKWDPITQSYLRTGHDGSQSPTPFTSIPHAFWWCIVTFTTVGYGDDVPATLPGKFVAACTMISGILVLAMPISVISMNFTEVWAEWNEERLLEAETRRQDLVSVSEALEGMDCRSHLLVELWDDRMGSEPPEFLGEVEWRDLPIDSLQAHQEDLVLPLQSNPRKRASTAAGTILLTFLWQPVTSSECLGDESRIQGTLEVRVRQAQALSRSDWKKAGLRDVFAIVHCWPRPPQGRGTNTAERYRTATVNASCNPVWEELVTFDFDWPLDWQPPVEKVRSRTRMKTLTREKCRSFSRNLTEGWCGSPMAASPPTTAASDEGLREIVELQGKEIRSLVGQVSEIKGLLRELRKELVFDRVSREPRSGSAGSQKSSPDAMDLRVPGSVE